jgi:hypothetical protein
MIATAQLVERIIKEQELVIGPLALREAKKVKGLTVKTDGGVKLTGSNKKVLGDLVKQYEKLFGPASLDVCREAVKALLPQVAKEDVPDILK